MDGAHRCELWNGLRWRLEGRRGPGEEAGEAGETFLQEKRGREEDGEDACVETETAQGQPRNFAGLDPGAQHAVHVGRGHAPVVVQVAVEPLEEERPQERRRQYQPLRVN